MTESSFSTGLGLDGDLDLVGLVFGERTARGVGMLAVKGALCKSFQDGGVRAMGE